MTREEFLNEICSWGDLVNFCYDNGCSLCDDIYDEEGRDDILNEELVSLAENADDWRELLDILENIPTDFEYYTREYNCDFSSLDDEDFESRKRDVLAWADSDGIWDDEEEDEDEYEYENEDNDFVIGEDPISIEQLMTACNDQVQQIIKEEETDDKMKAESFIEIFV